MIIIFKWISAQKKNYFITLIQPIRLTQTESTFIWPYAYCPFFPQLNHFMRNTEFVIYGSGKNETTMCASSMKMQTFSSEIIHIWPRIVWQWQTVRNKNSKWMFKVPNQKFINSLLFLFSFDTRSRSAHTKNTTKALQWTEIYK